MRRWSSSLIKLLVREFLEYNGQQPHFVPKNDIIYPKRFPPFPWEHQHSPHFKIDTGVFEIKFAKTQSEIPTLLDEGITQIRDRRYGKSTHAPVLKRAVLVFDQSSRQFVAWQETP